MYYPEQLRIILQNKLRMIKLLFKFERRKQISSGHKGQFDEACAQVNVHKNLAIFYKP